MKKYTFLIILFIGLFSCTKELELSNADNGLMVLNGLIDPNEYLSITLIKSSSVLDNEPIDEIRDATVSVFKDGTHLEDLIFTESEDTPVNKYYGQVKPEQGSNYSIEVSHPKYGKVSSNTTVPDSPSISDLYCEDSSDSLSELVQLKFNFTLNDSPGDDYYFVRLGLPIYRIENNVVGEFYGFNPIEISDQNISGQVYLNEGFIFSDEYFTSDQIEFSGIGKTLNSANSYTTATDFPPINADSLFLDTSKLIVRFEKISYDTYLFYTSHASYLEIWNDDYAEPTLIYNNIEDGLGLFGGINSFEALFDIE